MRHKKSPQNVFSSKLYKKLFLVLTAGLVFSVILIAYNALAATVTAINPVSGINDASVSITSVTGTGFTLGWDKETGLIGNWRLDETTGSTTADVSGSSHAGTLTNFSGASPWTTGKLSNAINFDGTNDYVVMNNGGSLGAGAFTISAWVKPSGANAANTHYIFNNQNTANTGLGPIFFYGVTTGALRTNINLSGGGPFVQGADAYALTAGTWYHTVTTYSGGTATSSIKIYRNGSEITYNWSASIAGSGTSDSGGKWVIGGKTYANDRNAKGIIDEVRVYNRVLSATEVAELYAATGPGSVKLTKAGSNDIACTGFTLTNSTTLSSGSCPITGALAGQWNVLETNPDATTTGTLTNGFTVNDPLPGTPGTPTYSNVSTSTLTASWTSASGVVSYYKLERAPDAGGQAGTFSQIATTTGLSYGDSGLSANTTYWYRVRATNATGDGSYSSNTSVLTLPDLPGTPTYSNIASSTLTTSWTAPAGGATYYKLERAPDFQGSPGTFAQIATTTSLSYGDSGLSSGTTYWYRVRATNATGDGSYSGNASVTTNAAPTLSISQPDGVNDTVTVGDLYNITYTLADTDNVVTSAFYYDTNATGLDGVAITGACATAAEGTGVTCSWNTTGVTPGSYYVYGITNDGLNPQVSAYSSGTITIEAASTPTVTAINPTSGTNNGTTSITSVTGTNFKSGWDKENGLVGNWRLDEATVGNAIDSSGTGNTGTSNGTATTTGQVNNARTFNGVADGDDVTIANSSSLQFSGGSITISAWIKPTSAATIKQGIVDKRDGVAETGFGFITSDSAGGGDRLKFIRGSSFVNGVESTDNILTAGTWQHVAVSFNGTTATFYRNGTAQGSGNPAGGTSLPNTTAIKIGERANGASSVVNFTGSIDEVRIYNRALSATEISELYNATSTNPSLKLKKSGQTDIACSAFSLTSSTTLSSGSCPLNGVATGAWDVQVQNGNAATGTLAAGFTVNAATTSPDATSVSYTVGGDGGISGDSITITGTNFGTVSAGSRADCAGSTGTGCVKFIVGGTDTVADASVTSWSTTSIAFTVPSALASNGGAAALQVFAASASDTTPLAFYIYPNVTALASVGSNAGREYNAADTDGLIMLSGDHFGTAGTATILGSSATQHATTGGNCTVGGYATTTICYEVPTAISDTLYSGSIVLTRTSDSKTSTWTSFGILPRIAANSPTAGPVGTTIQITGDHFCNTGTCPVSPNRSATTNNVKFGSTQAADSDFVTPTSGATTVTSASLTTSGTNRLLLAFVSVKNTSSQTVSSVTNSGTALTWVSVASTTNSTNVRLEVWRALATSAFSGTVTATLSASAKATIVVAAFSGVNTGGTNGSGAIGITGSATGNSTAPSVAITTGSSNSLVVSALSAQGTPGVTAGSSQTLISTQTTTGGADSTRVTGAGERQNSLTASPSSVTSNYTLGASAQWATIAVEIKQ